MGFFSNLLGRGKPQIDPKLWSDYAIKQLTSERWDEVRKEFYKRSKMQVPEIRTIPEDIFIAEMLGAQLELLSFASFRTNRKLYKIYPTIREYIHNLKHPIRGHVEESYNSANKKVAAFGSKGITADIAIATAFAERLKLDVPSEFITELAEEFDALGQMWINDISQYRFVELNE